MKTKRELRLPRRRRIRARVAGTAARPRIAVFRSHKALYVQFIDDVKGITLVSGHIVGTTVAQAKILGVEVAQKAKKAEIKAAVFDRGGYRYHGVIKTLAESIREGGVTI